MTTAGIFMQHHLAMSLCETDWSILHAGKLEFIMPPDKARAVVDAMERDMATTLATKQDLQMLATKTEFMELTQEVQLLRQEFDNRYTLLAHEITTLRGDVSRDLKTLGLKMTLSLGSMLMVGFGLTITALRVWL